MIIGITGTLGAGKGTVVQYLVDSRKFRHFSVRNFLIEKLAERGLTSNRDTMVQVANELRAKHGPEHIAKQLLERARVHGGDAVIESIRTVGEAMHLKAHGASIWAVDADVRKRYERIVKRASETDSVSFDKFVSDEKREFSNTDPTKGNISAVMALADVVLFNEHSVEELFVAIEDALAEHGRRP